MKKSIVFLVACLVLLVAAPANAYAHYHAWIKYPMLHHHVVIQGGTHIMNMRVVARYYDAKVGGITIDEKGYCASQPHATCVIVHKRNYGRTVWWGKTIVWGDGTRIIKLNTYWGADQHLACHEFGHALGLGHHDSPGCVTMHFGTRWPSRDELRTLRHYYD